MQKKYLLIKSEFFMIQIHKFMQSLARYNMFFLVSKELRCETCFVKLGQFNTNQFENILCHAWGIAVSFEKDF